MKDQLKELIAYVLSWGIVIAALAISLGTYTYTQRYITKDNVTAERGIWFTNTIELNLYKHIGSGSGLFGKYDSYSRSDRHETISVYKD